ncbi:protein sprouty [Malaya genurostris]|uniref:protein sprouty n=1 Tax=Malaya genurostris TaxID=325434 RepID=UPI0026F3CE45|nr:protein sprouty [Malaya genurostris]
MDRRNGGDPLAPPRPPKSLPRVHRPRAPEPTIMSATVAANNNNNQSTASNNANTTTISTTTNRSLNNVPQLSPKPRNLSSSSSPARNISSNISSSIPPPLPPAPQIVPLTPLSRSNSHNHHHQPTTHHHLPSSNTNSNSVAQPASTFSRRRPPAALPSISIPSILGPSIDTTASNTTTTSATSPVTLAAPRPENERLTNEYVDTPFSRLSPASNHQRHQPNAVGPATTPGTATSPVVLHPANIPEQHRQLSVSHTNNRLHSPSANSSSNSTTVSTLGKPIGSTATTTTLHGSSRNFNNNSINTRPNQLPLGQTTATSTTTTTTRTTTTSATGTPLSAGGSPTIQSALPITKQPVSNAFSKDPPTAGLHELDIDLHPSHGDLLNSVTCPQCKKCRCEGCQRPRQLPSRWLCDNTCLCSAETIIDYASCLCCVKALYYHCAKDPELERENDTISDPCSCLPHKRTARWGCLGALSLALPCLWCYWPMRGCVALCAKCYAKHSRHGCRCQTQNGSSITGSILTGGSRGGGGNGLIGGGQGGNGNVDHHSHGNTISSKFSAVNSTSPFGKGHHHHHHHHHHNNSHHHHHHSDLTPEKRLLDSSPEY